MNCENLKTLHNKIKSNNKSRNITKANINLENLSVKKKIELIKNLFFSSNDIESISYEISSWDADYKIEKLFRLNNKSNASKIASYKNGKKPGLFYKTETLLDDIFLINLLTNHFNFEKGLSPSLNIKVIVYIIRSNSKILLDIYDDRGLNFYFILDK